MKKEIEIKIELSPEEFTKLAPRSGSFAFEKTFGFFKEDFSNCEEGIFPRIKQIIGKGKKNEIIFTVKVKKNENTAFFERLEMEVKLAEGENIDDLRGIIKVLGYSKEIIFEKKRKNVFKDIIISFDELPFGFFVEFEGEPENIDRYLKKFNLSDRPRITKAYLAVWEDYQKISGDTQEHCVFK